MWSKCGGSHVRSDRVPPRLGVWALAREARPAETRPPAPIVRNCLRDTMGQVLSPCASARTRASEPGRNALPELLQLGETQPRARGGRRPRPGRVVAPGRQIEPDVLEIGVSGHVLQRLESILDEPDTRPTTGRGGE